VIQDVVAADRTDGPAAERRRTTPPHLDGERPHLQLIATVERRECAG